MDWGALVAATLRLYQQAAQETGQKVLRYWWVGFLPLLYALIFFLVAGFTASFGLIGGLIAGLVLALCASSYLSFLAGIVNGSRVSPQDLLESWRPYFSSVLTILFFLTLIEYTLALLLPPAPGTGAIRLVVNLVLLVILNPVPEIIYQGRSEGLNVLQESVEFLRESGVEWFLPIVALALLSLVFSLPILMMPLEIGRFTFPTFGGQALLLGSVGGLVWAAGSVFLLFVLMVFRGLLFRALAAGTRRQRIYRSRFS